MVKSLRTRLITSGAVLTHMLLLCGSAGFAQQAPPAASGGASLTVDPLKPVKLRPFFADDFQHDTRADYSSKGDLSWAPGELTLEKGAGLQRAVRSGDRIRLELELKWPKVTKDRPNAELQVWFRLEGATPCSVRLRQALQGARQVDTAAIVDGFQQNGRVIESVAREVQLPEGTIEQVDIEYWHGLIDVSSQGKPLLAHAWRMILPLWRRWRCWRRKTDFA